jgi:FkbM family methyltransferase
MKLYKNTLFGLRHNGWTRMEAIAYFMKGVARELKIAPGLFEKFHKACVMERKEKEYAKFSTFSMNKIQLFKEKWLKQNGEESCFDFGICKLPDISNSEEYMIPFMGVFAESLLFPCFFNDNYDSYLVNLLDPYIGDGPYGYTDGAFDVTVRNGDIVIDAGAWIGDFSAYAAYKGATSYAFEPVNEMFQLLSKTKDLNNTNVGGAIYPIRKGLGSNECETDMLIDNGNGLSSSIIHSHDREYMTEKRTISVTTIDKFVEENNLEQIDFIKADIEGAERDMLKGATNVLKTFAPKLAICTYHLPDDPEVLERIIREANPAYTVVHLRHKLYAAVVNKN